MKEIKEEYEEDPLKANIGEEVEFKDFVDWVYDNKDFITKIFEKDIRIKVVKFLA